MGDITNSVMNGNTMNLLILSFIVLVFVILIYFLIKKGGKIQIGKFSLSNEQNINYNLLRFKFDFHEDCNHYLDVLSERTSHKFYHKELTVFESLVINEQIYGSFRRALIENGIDEKFPNKQSTVQWLNKINNEIFNRIEESMTFNDGVDKIKDVLESEDFTKKIKSLELEITTQLRDICIKFFIKCKTYLEELPKNEGITTEIKKYERKINEIRGYDISISDIVKSRYF